MQNADRPPSDPPFRIEVTDQPGDAAQATILHGLVAFTAALIGPANRRTLAVLVSAEDGTILGGVTGFTAWGWLLIEKVWLADTLRGRGLAADLLARAEAEAARRGCHGVWLDTLNPVAKSAYQRQGYHVFGELKDFPPGHSRFFMQKQIEPKTE